MKKILFLVLLFFCFHIFADSDPECQVVPVIPANDCPDDNFSFAYGNSKMAFFNIENQSWLAILRNGYYEPAHSFLQNIGRNPLYVKTEFEPDLIQYQVKMILIPCGGLFGKSNDSIFKVVLEEYVRLGGTIIVFAQQYGGHFDKVLPIPAEESLHSYGFREDQSCFNGSLYFKEVHPVLSGLTNEKVNVAIDGYFSQYPGNATVLLRRITNQEPALLYYPYGNGTVIVTSLYTDWGSAHSQASADELKVVRDLVTFAMNPNLPISMYDLNVDPNPPVNLSVRAKNSSAKIAAKIKIKVATPDRDGVLYQVESDISLNPEAETYIPLEFSLPAVLDSQLGICHADYELYDAEDALIQPATESITGRFAIFKTPAPIPEFKGLNMWLTMSDEYVLVSEKAKFILHVRNNSDEAIAANFEYSWSHNEQQPLFDLQIPAKEAIDQEIEVLPIQWGYDFGKRWDSYNVFCSYSLAGQPLNMRVSKGMFIVSPQTESRITVATPNLKFGDPLQYQIHSENKCGRAIDTNIVLRLMKNEQEIATLHSTPYQFPQDGVYDYSGTFAGLAAYGPGQYSLKLKVAKAGGNTEIEFATFSCNQSDVQLNVEEIIGSVPGENDSIGRLVPGSNCQARFKIKNNSPYALAQGRYLLVLKSQQGSIAFQHEVQGIAFAAKEEKEFQESFVFNQAEPGKYFIQIEYLDETRNPETKIQFHDVYIYPFSLSVFAESFAYYYLASAKVTLNINALGHIHLKVNCPGMGFAEERDLQIANNATQVNEIFQVPVTASLSSAYPVNVEGRDDFGNIYSASISLLARGLNFLSNGRFETVPGSGGSSVNFTLKTEEIVGNPIPFSGELHVFCAGLNLDASQTVTVQPLIWNEYAFPIAIAESVPAGSYEVQAQLNLGGTIHDLGKYTLQIAPAQLAIQEPGKIFNGGDPLVLNFENRGGRNGVFSISISLNDKNGLQVLTHDETMALSVGETKTIDLTIPNNILSGTYYLDLKGEPQGSGMGAHLLNDVQITGLNALLNSYTLKEEYLDTEIIAGRSEIGAQNGNIAGELQARIVKASSGVDVKRFPPGEFTMLNSMAFGFGTGSKLVFICPQDIRNKVIEYDIESGNCSLLFQTSESIGLEWPIYVRATGEIWITTALGLYRRDSAGNIHYYTDQNGLLPGKVNHIIERNDSGQAEMWFSSESGISVFKNETWSAYTHVNGLPSNNVYDLEIDSTGLIWGRTPLGLFTYDGSVFQNVTTSFDSAKIVEMAITDDGSVWILYSFMSFDQQLFRLKNGIWENWQVSELYPNLTNISKIDANGYELWAVGVVQWPIDESYGYSILIRYKEGFQFFRTTDVPISDVSSPFSPSWILMPNKGNGMYIKDNYPGLVEYKDGKWNRIYIQKDRNKPLEIRNSSVIVEDKQGRIIVGAGYSGGLFIYDKNKFQNILQVSSGRPIGIIGKIVLGNNGKIFATDYVEFGNKRIIEICKSSVNDLLFSGDGEIGDICVDSEGILWMTHWNSADDTGYLYWFNGQWNKINAPVYFENSFITITADKDNGIWISETNYWDNKCKIYHLHKDLTYEEFNSSNTPLLSEVYNIDKIKVDKDGKLWSFNRNNLYPPNYYSLLSFDGLEWKEYCQMSGFPSYGILDITWDDTGQNYFLGMDDDGNGIIYFFANTSFEPIFPNQGMRLNDNFVFSNGSFFCLEYQDIYDHLYLTEFHPLSGIGYKDVWSNSYPVTVNNGETTNLDFSSGMAIASGNYVLKTKLVSDLNQVLAEKENYFSVEGANVVCGLCRSGSSCPHVKPGETVEIKGIVKNKTSVSISDLVYVVKKVSPSGVVSIIHEETLNLDAGQVVNRKFIFKENEIGTWKINAEVSQGESLLSSAELLLEVVRPKVHCEYLHPEYAGDEPFAVKVRLINDGKIASNIHVIVGAQDVVPLMDEDINLLPGEERLLTAQDTIAIDKTYDVQLSGDVNVSEQFSVKYGYQESFVVIAQPQCREGAILVGYTIENSGGLPFADTAHFELYAAGNGNPLYELDKTYNLYPGADAINDSVSFVLGPGTYELRCHTGRVAQSVHPIQVLPAGLALLSDYAVSPHYPPGLNDFAFALTNTDSVAGNIPLTMEIKDGAGATVFNEARTYFLQAAEKKTDSFSFAFSQPGNYTVSWSGVKLEQPVAAVFKVLPLVDVAATTEILPVANGSAPVRVSVQNNGFLDFAGSVRIEASGMNHEEALAVASTDAFTGVFALDCNGLASGTQELKAYVLDGAGAIIAQAAQNIAIHGADIQVVAVPQNLEIAAGSYAEARLRLKNEGNLRGEAKLRINAFDTLSEERAVVLEAGEELELSGLFIDADGDMPAGNYTCAWVLSGSGVSGGNGQGTFPFTVSGVQVQVNAQLDKDIYAVGDTANLNLQISAPGPVTAPLEAVCNWGDFNERKAIDLAAGNCAIEFDIPINEARQDKVFYGVYFSDGRGLYLNDLYLRLSGLLSVTLDRQVYSPGQTVHATFHSTDAGTLTAESFGQSFSQAISGSLGLDFPLPAGTLGGSYGVAWEFVPNDAGKDGDSGAARFDVSGLVVKVSRAELEKGKYAPGETVRANLLLESNSDETLPLSSWIVSPSGEWDFIEEKEVAVTAGRQVAASIAGNFNTTEAGTHQLVYGLYRGSKLVTSGANAFDCGDAVLLGVATDRLEYPQGNESVLVNWDGFGSGQAALGIYLDNTKVEERAVALSGLSKGQVAIDSAYVGGGGHSLRAVLRQGSLASERDTQFVYGSQLGDLSIALTERIQDGWTYSYKMRVSNNGKKVTSGTVLVFSVDGQDEAAATVAQLQPGESQELAFSWSGVQKAGSHILRFDVDPGDGVKEFDETNNRLQLNEEVVELELVMESEPELWQANTEVTLFSRLFNNRAAAGTFRLQLTVTGLQSSQIMFQREKTITISPFAQTAESDLFSTGMYPAGEYEIKQTLSGEGLQLQREFIVTLAASKQIAAELQVTPAVITAEKDSTLTLHIDCQNIGNVNLSGEALGISVERKQTGETVTSEQILLDLDMGQEKSWESVLTVNVSPGEYQVLLKLAGKTVASAEFAALSGTVVEKRIAFAPRVLFLNTLAAPWNWCKVWFSNVLQAANVFCEDSNKIADGYGKYQKGENNIIVVFGNLTNVNLKKEIVERVYRGEGAILVLGSAVNLAGWEELAGVKAKIVPAALAESELEIAASEFSPGGFLRLKNPAKMELFKKDATTQILGWSKVSKKIMLARHNFGLGQVLTIAFKPDLVSGGELLEKLLLQAVRLFARDVYSISEISRVLPVGITVHNNEALSHDFVVKESIPLELKAFGFSPMPEKPEAPEWKFSIAANGKKEIGYWLELPNQVKAWDVTSDVSVAGEEIGKPLLSLEVKDTYVERIDWVLGQLEMLQLSGQDKAKINYVRQNLLKMRKRKGDSAAVWNRSLTDAIRAAGKLAEVKSKDLSALRREVQNLMIYCGRRFYEASVHFRSEEIQQIMDSQANEADQAEEPQIEN